MLFFMESPRLLINEIASDETIDAAYQWLCRRRKNYSHNNDVWRLRGDWARVKPDLQRRLRNGEYRFSPQDEIRLPDTTLELWQARDSLVLKAMAIVLGNYLAPVLSARCFHLAGAGGCKAALNETAECVSDPTFSAKYVMKSDVRGYYASMDHDTLYTLLCTYITDEATLDLLWGYLRRTVSFGENYRDVTRGISLGCPLSPLMGALYLKPLDDMAEKNDFFYARFMDDWAIITTTRWKLKRAIASVNQILTDLKLEKSPEKTFIGKVCQGFDFLGYFLAPCVIRLSGQSLDKLSQRMARLYEQGADDIRVGQYVGRWMAWAFNIKSAFFFAPI